MHLLGYTSTTTAKEIAEEFALFEATDDLLPVIYKITFTSQKGLFSMSHGYSAYDEQEVLVQDGL